MNITKIIAALEEVDELAHGMIYNTGNVCALGQLFRASGKSYEDMFKEMSMKSVHIFMFNRLLQTEYGLTRDDTENIWQCNDYVGVLDESPKARHMRMIEWFKNQIIDDDDQQNVDEYTDSIEHVEELIGV